MVEFSFERSIQDMINVHLHSNIMKDKDKYCTKLKYNREVMKDKINTVPN